MAKTISQRISLEGSEEVKKALEALSAAAAKSAAEVNKASEAGGDGFSKTGEAAAKAAEGIAKTAEASQQAGGELKQVAVAADKTAESFRGVSLEAVKTGAEIAKIGAEIALTGIKIQRALVHHDSFVQSIIKLGLHASSAVRTLEAFGLALGPVAVTLGVIGGAAVGAGIALLALEKAATAAAKGYEALNHQLQMLAQTSGTSFESLQKGSAAFEQMGIKSETARNAVIKLDETMKSFDTGAKIKETTDKLIQSEKELLEAKQRADEAGGTRMTFNEKMRLLDINKQLENSTTNLGKANEELGTKQSAFATLAANDLSKIIPLIKQIEQGQKGIKFDEATTAETKVAALTARLKEVKDKTGDARQAFVSIIASAATLKDAIAFGKQAGFSDEDVDRIRRFGGEASKIPDLFKRMETSGALIGPGASKSFDDMRTSIQDVENAWIRLEQAWASPVLASFGASISNTFNSMKAAVINFAAAASEAFFTMLSQIGQGWVILGRKIAAGVTTAVGGAWQWIVDTFNAALAGVGSAASAAVASIAAFVTTPVANAWQWIVDMFNKVKASLGFGGAAEGGQVGAHAGGGLLGGRGTGTSDSNLAWVSRGEYITPARAVSQPGVLAFLEALRRSGGSLRDVFDGMGRFALGGMVRAPMALSAIPAFAGGGMNAVTINFPGLPEITGLRASSGVVDELRKAAAMAQVRSGGRKPSRYS